MLLFRDRFLKHLFARFPNTFDLEEIWGIVQDLSEQAIKVNTQYMELSNSNSESYGEQYYEEYPDYGSEASSELSMHCEAPKADLNCPEMIKLADNDSLVGDESDPLSGKNLRD